MNTHTFKLLSGVECEIKELSGKEQRIMTEQKSKAHGEKLKEMLLSVIVRVGSVKDIDAEFLEQMLSCDTAKILVELRQFSMDFEEFFHFTYKYTTRDGEKGEHELEYPLKDAKFPEVKVKRMGEDGELVDADYTEYSEVIENKKVKVTLPRSGEVVEFTMLDGKGERVGSAIKKADQSSHTNLEMRVPKRFEKKESGNTLPIKLNLDRLVLKDIEYLRKEIARWEGRVDTEIRFEHPEADFKVGHEKEVTINLLNTIAFFFPSEAI